MTSFSSNTESYSPNPNIIPARQIYWSTKGQNITKKKRLIFQSGDVASELSKSVNFKKIRKVQENEKHNLKVTSSLKGKCVCLTVRLAPTGSKASSLLRVSVLVRDLAKILDKTTEEINEALAAKTLPLLIQGKLTEELDSVSSSDATGDDSFKVASQYGVSNAKFEKIKKFVDNTVFDEAVNRHYRKKHTGLSHSIVNIATGPQKGTYVLLKKAFVGEGAYSRATLAMNIDTGELKIWKTTRKKKVSPTEDAIYESFSEDSTGVVYGSRVDYVGHFASRKKKVIHTHYKAQKTGFMMDFIEGGTLAARLKDPDFDQKSRIIFAEKFVRALAEKIHSKGYVHHDLKLDNICVDKDKNPRIVDFGMATTAGTLHESRGTLGYIAPEVHNAFGKTPSFKADPKNDMWSVGCILVRMFGPESWIKLFEEMNMDYDVLAAPATPNRRTPEEVKRLTRRFRNRAKGTIEYDIEQLIKGCLRFDPAERLSSAELADGFRAILEKYHL